MNEIERQADRGLTGIAVEVLTVTRIVEHNMGCCVRDVRVGRSFRPTRVSFSSTHTRIVTAVSCLQTESS